MGFSALLSGEDSSLGLEITAGNAGGAPLFVIAGELDVSTVPRFRQTVEDGLQDASGIALDLRDVALVDASGLDALLHLAPTDGRGRPVVLVCHGPSIPRLLELTQLADRFTVVGSVDEIPAAFAAISHERGPEDAADRDAHDTSGPA